MPAFTTSCRRGFYFGCASALSVACATQVDEPPNQGNPLVDAAGTGAVAGSGAQSPMETAGSGGNGGTAVGGNAGISSVSGSGGASGGSGGASGGTAGSGGVVGGSGGAAGSAGRGGNAGASGAGGTSGAGGASAGGAGGKSSGGSAGAGGSAATQTCAKNPITAKTKWLVTASSSDGPAPPSQACDNMVATRWSTGKEQVGMEWLQLDFGAVVTLTKLTLVLGTSVDDYPRKYATRFSNSLPVSSAPVLVSGMGAKATDTVMTFPAGTTGRYLLINQSGTAPALWWSVAEIQAECAD